MAAPDAPLPEIHVHPGECRVVSQPSLLRTVLGSCVGVTFFVPRLGIGAICHPMLPHCPAHRRDGLAGTARRRYVDLAIRDLARHLDSLGVHRAEAQVKLFGGCDVLPVAADATRPTVGRLNAEAALRVLAEEGFAVSASRLGGKAGVRIDFRTDSGEVMLRRLAGGGEESPARRHRGSGGLGPGRR